MNGSDLLAVCREALAAAGEAQVEISARIAERGCARFAVGALEQHVQLSESQVALRVARGRRVAELVTSATGAPELVEAIRETAQAASYAPEIEGFDGFAAGDETPGEAAHPPRFAPTTARATAGDRVARLRPAIDAVAAAGLVAAGMLETTRAAHAVATTRGCARSCDTTLAAFRVWALDSAGGGGASGYGGQVHRDFDALRFDVETDRAIRIACASRDPIALDEGAYDVVLEPEAVTELLEWLAVIAFAAPEIEQGTSPLAGRWGEPITGSAIDIAEDPLSASELGFGVPFDREGTPRQRVALIEGGRARGALYDRAHAARAGTKSTGSALLPRIGAAGGVGATSLWLGAGDASSVDDLLATVERGLYICRLHYVNGLLDPRRAVMTGLTRDGCFLVEKGRIGRAVGNLRFTDSLLEGLARSDGMTRARKAVCTWWSETGAFVAPAVRMRAFRFNGRSQERPSL